MENYWWAVVHPRPLIKIASRVHKHLHAVSPAKFSSPFSSIGGTVLESEGWPVEEGIEGHRVEGHRGTKWNKYIIDMYYGPTPLPQYALCQYPPPIHYICLQRSGAEVHYKAQFRLQRLLE